MIKKVYILVAFVALSMILGCGDADTSSSIENINEIQNPVSTNVVEMKEFTDKTINKVVVNESVSQPRNEILNVSEDNTDVPYINVIGAYESAINDVYNRVLPSIVHVEVEYDSSFSKSNCFNISKASFFLSLSR